MRYSTVIHGANATTTTAVATRRVTNRPRGERMACHMVVALWPIHAGHARQPCARRAPAAADCVSCGGVFMPRPMRPGCATSMHDNTRHANNDTDNTVLQEGFIHVGRAAWVAGANHTFHRPCRYLHRRSDVGEDTSTLLPIGVQGLETNFLHRRSVVLKEPLKSAPLYKDLKSRCVTEETS